MKELAEEVKTARSLVAKVVYTVVERVVKFGGGDGFFWGFLVEKG